MKKKTRNREKIASYYISFVTYRLSNPVRSFFRILIIQTERKRGLCVYAMLTNVSTEQGKKST